MKKLVGIAAAIGGLAVIAGICYFVYKHFFCCCCEVMEKTANVMEILAKQKLPLTQEAILTSEEYRKQLQKVKFLKQKQISKSD